MLSLDTLKELPLLYDYRRHRYRNRFLNEEFGTFWGVFDSFNSALSSVPKEIASSYQDESLVDFHLDQFMQLLPFDWPVLYFLSDLISKGSARSMIDFGGHVGVKYYAYQKLLALPDDFHWRVVDLAPMVAEGRRRCADFKPRHLTFYDDVALAPASDILFCSGVLQFCPFTVDAIIQQCVSRPRYVIINKIPFSQDGAFVTLENFNKVKVAYQVFDRHRHDADREKLGYELLWRWRIPHRDFEIPYSKPRRNVKMFGEIWAASPDMGERAHEANIPTVDAKRR